MKKFFVLDTNVLLLDPLSIFKFGKDDVIIPLICIEELDRFKKDQNENGRNARHFSRIIDDLRKKGHLSQGIPLDNGGTLTITNNSGLDTIPGFQNGMPNSSNQVTNSTSTISQVHATLSRSLVMDKSDNLILGLALELKEKGHQVSLITQDINLRLKADVFNIKAEDFSIQRSVTEQSYSGYLECSLPHPLFEEFVKNGFLSYEKLSSLKIKSSEGNYLDLSTDNKKEITLPFHYNQYLILTSTESGQKTYARYCNSRSGKGITSLIQIKDGVWGIFPKNIEQHFALDALLNDDIKLVTLAGKAGTGKTLIAIAAALDKTITRGEYIRLLVSRPIQPMGKDLGFLPGSIEEKMNPWMLPIFDALDFIFGKYKYRDSSGPAAWMALKEKGLLQVEPLTYIRGRSIPSQFFIIDEAQNLSPHELKTIITRVGEGSKIILSGDYEQVDNPYLDTVNNGLTYVIDRLRGQEAMAHVTLQTGERSLLSELASKLL